jgi:hypothetical protein
MKHHVQFCSKLLHVASPAPPPCPESGPPRPLPPIVAPIFPTYTLPPAPANLSRAGKPRLSDLLRGIQRPPDIKAEHLEALGLRVHSDAPLELVIPDASFLPPASWTPQYADEEENLSSRHRLSNERDSPGGRVYLERVRELSIANGDAFRTLRRHPAPSGKLNPRLGNAYEFYKFLEMLSGFWIDTSPDGCSADMNAADGVEKSASEKKPKPYQHLIGSGAQTPPEFRTAILAALTRLVAYDFGCNVTLARVEPRLFITADGQTSSFPTNVSFVYRTPTNRASARSGVVEGPVAGLSARHTTDFKTPFDNVFDLCREVAAVLVTAQQRARETKTEKRPPKDVWWCHKPRWGGGPGGPIGREADNFDEVSSAAIETAPVDAPSSPVGHSVGDLPGASPSSPRGNTRPKGRQSSIYDGYRMVRPPRSTWDRKTRYLSIGKPPGASCDDIFLLSCLNHHVSIVRVQVPMGLLDELEGAEPPADVPAMGCVMWRSRWYDLFSVEDRVQAMSGIWGMMGYLMRAEGGGDRDMASPRAT